MVADEWMRQPWGGGTDSTQRRVGGLTLGRLKVFHCVQCRHAKSTLSSHRHPCTLHTSTAVTLALLSRAVLLSFQLQSVAGCACWKRAD